MRSMTQVFEDMYAASAQDKLELEEQIKDAVERLGEVSDAWVSVRNEYELSKDLLQGLVRQYDDRFSSQVEIENEKIWEGHTCRALFRAVTKKNILVVTPEELYARGGLKVFSPSMRDCTNLKILKQEDFDACFSKELTGRSVKSVLKYSKI